MPSHAASTCARIAVSLRRLCSWPDCSVLADSRGFCRKHGLRVARGAEPGCETAWEQLWAAFLSAADVEAEDDAGFALAERRLKAAIDRYCRCSRSGRGRGGPA